MLLPESAVAYLPGLVDRMAFAIPPTLELDGGWVYGYRYASDGRRVSRVRVRVADGTTAHASAWAVINGVAHLRLSDGPLAGRWVHESDLRLTD